MYEHTVKYTTTQTTKPEDHRGNLLLDMGRASSEGWELVTAQTLMHDGVIDTLTFWKRDAAGGTREQPTGEQPKRYGIL